MSRRNENGISMNRAFAKLLSDGSEVERLRAELDDLRAEVKEWLCIKCNMVYPGPPANGVSGVLCRTCGGLTGPRLGIELRKAIAREKALSEELDALKEEPIVRKLHKACFFLRAENKRLRKAMRKGA